MKPTLFDISTIEIHILYFFNPCCLNFFPYINFTRIFIQNYKKPSLLQFKKFKVDNNIVYNDKVDNNIVDNNIVDNDIVDNIIR